MLSSSLLTNALKEFPCAFSEVAWAELRFEDRNYQSSTMHLNPGYSDVELASFKQWLGGINYDAGYGMQHLYGEIFCNNDKWYLRYEYDGTEAWERFRLPRPQHPRMCNVYAELPVPQQQITWAQITFNSEPRAPTKEQNQFFDLKPGHSDEELAAWVTALKALEYDVDDPVHQHLSGTICTDEHWYQHEKHPHAHEAWILHSRPDYVERK